MKKLLSLSLVLLFVFSFFPVTAVANSLVADELIVENESSLALQEHIQNNLELFRKVIIRNSTGNIKISEPFPICGTNDDRFITFVFDEVTCIGFLTTAYHEGELFSSLTVEKLDDMKDYHDKQQSLLVVVEEDTATGIETLCFLTTKGSLIGKEIILKEFSLPDADVLVNYTPYNISLDVPYVTNVNVNQKGLCWAACIAAISNYKNNTSYGALDIYRALNEEYLGTPEGTTTWYNRGFTYCNLHCTSVAGGLPFLQVFDELFDDNPVIFSLKSNSDDVSHGIVCKSAEGDYDMCIYGFMDPNRSGTTYAYIDNPENPENFHYTSPVGEVYYDEWMYARYSIV